MKKFTAIFLTALLFAVTSVFSCFSVYADEIALDDEITADVEIDEDWYWDSDFSLSSDYNLLSNEDSFMFYDQLDANNKAAYDVMKSWLEPRTDTLTVSLPEPVSYQTDSLDMSGWSAEQSEEFGSIVASCIKDGKTALVLDYPELFWFDENNIKISISYSTSYNYRKKLYTIKINKVYVTASICDVYKDTEIAAEYIAFLKESIDNFEVKGTDYYTKVKYIHDYIANAVKYNMDSPYRNTALGVFLEPYEVVCEGYSETVKLLCDKENIPCISVIGNVNPASKSAHMWNYVQMEDGKWYALDCTWDDLDEDDEPLKYQYFLTGASSFLANHTPDSTYITPNFTYPELSETDYIYNSSGPIVTTTSVSTEGKSTTITTVKSTVSSAKMSSKATTITTVKSTVSSAKASSKATTNTTVKNTVSSTKTSSKATTLTTATSSVTVIAVSTTESVNSVIKGDFNENGVLDIGDAVMLQKKLVKMDVIKTNDYKYELNGDNVINVFDFIILRRLLINM